MKLRDEELCHQTRHDDLLLHYLNGAQRTIESIDQLGNFLMGFGVLALGYLLNANLQPVTRWLTGVGGHQGAAALTLAAWGIAVLALLAFVFVYIFRVLAGRAVHAQDGREDGVGEVLDDLPEDLSFPTFMQHQRSFGDFVRTHFHSRDHRSPEALLYARWSYMRFMGLKKLVEMNRMRTLLGLGLVCGTAYKFGVVYLGAV